MSDFNFDNFQEEDVCFDTYADIVYCIDATASMQPCINKVKQVTRTLHKELDKALLDSERKLVGLRIKVIAFRDFYVDGPKSLEQSRFFNIPDELSLFEDFISGIQAKGGGDLPENSLEAFAMAMNSDWRLPTNKDAKYRQIIVLFTDAPAHNLEKQEEMVIKDYKYYPKGMPKDYTELIEMWGDAAQGNNQEYDESVMHPTSKRFALFAPENEYPWNSLQNDCTLTVFQDMASAKGGADIDTEAIIATLSQTVS